MEQKLIAFWKYDTAPYIIGGEVESFTTEGKVRVKGFSGFVFTPIKVLPYEKGMEIKNQIEQLGRETRRLEAEIHANCRNSVNALLENVF